MGGKQVKRGKTNGQPCSFERHAKRFAGRKEINYFKRSKQTAPMTGAPPRWAVEQCVCVCVCSLFLFKIKINAII